MKFNKLLMLIALILLILPIVNAVPPWKKQQPAPTTTKEIIIINQTVAAPEEGVNWEMIGVIIALLTITAGVIGWLLTRKKSSTTSKYISRLPLVFD